MEEIEKIECEECKRKQETIRELIAKGIELHHAHAEHIRQVLPTLAKMLEVFQ